MAIAIPETLTKDIDIVQLKLQIEGKDNLTYQVDLGPSNINSGKDSVVNFTKKFITSGDKNGLRTTQKILAARLEFGRRADKIVIYKGDAKPEQLPAEVKAETVELDYQIGCNKCPEGDKFEVQTIEGETVPEGKEATLIARIEFDETTSGLSDSDQRKILDQCAEQAKNKKCSTWADELLNDFIYFSEVNAIEDCEMIQSTSCIGIKDCIETKIKICQAFGILKEIN